MRQARCDSQTRAHPPGTLRYRVNGAQATSPRQAETPYEATKDRPRNARPVLTVADGKRIVTNWKRAKSPRNSTRSSYS